MRPSFVLVSPPRAGSTLLRMALDSFDGVRCHGELFNRRIVRGYEDGFAPLLATSSQRQAREGRLLRERDRDPVGFLKRALAMGELASGFKALYETLDDPAWRRVVEWLRAEENLCVIDLSRSNELRRYVSEQVMRAGGPIHSGPGGRSQQHVRVSIDPAAFVTRVAQLRDQRTRILERFDGHSVFSVRYEDLASRFSTTVRGVADFLGIPSDVKTIVPPLRKVGSDDLADVVSNIEELRRDSRTASYLDG